MLLELDLVKDVQPLREAAVLRLSEGQVILVDRLGDAG